MTLPSIPSREIRFARRPEGAPTLDTFAMETVEVPPPAAGQVQVRNLWMSVDPYMRGRMTTRQSYVPPFRLGEPLEGGAIGRVETSACEGFAPGDLVQSMLGWREAFNAPASALTKVPSTNLPPEALLGVAGLPGLTAFVGVEKVIQLRAGEVFFVSAASGAVGAVACQIAKLRGATVIGSAGGAEKCAFLREIGVDRTIDYKAEQDLPAALAAAAPQGIDAYFDNVGGDHLDAALQAAKSFARFALCGMISEYNRTEHSPTPQLRLAVPKRLRLEGFIVSDHFDLMPGFGAADGRLGGGRRDPDLPVGGRGHRECPRRVPEAVLRPQLRQDARPPVELREYFREGPIPIFRGMGDAHATEEAVPHCQPRSSTNLTYAGMSNFRVSPAAFM